MIKVAFWVLVVVSDGYYSEGATTNLQSFDSKEACEATQVYAENTKAFRYTRLTCIPIYKTTVFKGD